MDAEPNEHRTTDALHEALRVAGRRSLVSTAPARITPTISAEENIRLTMVPRITNCTQTGNAGGCVDELRQERHEEDRRIRVENLDGDALEEGAPAGFRLDAGQGGIALRLGANSEMPSQTR